MLDNLATDARTNSYAWSKDCDKDNKQIKRIIIPIVRKEGKLRY